MEGIFDSSLISLIREVEKDPVLTQLNILSETNLISKENREFAISLVNEFMGEVVGLYVKRRDFLHMLKLLSNEVDLKTYDKLIENLEEVGKSYVNELKKRNDIRGLTKIYVILKALLKNMDYNLVLKTRKNTLKEKLASIRDHTRNCINQIVDDKLEKIDSTELLLMHLKKGIYKEANICSSIRIEEAVLKKMLADEEIKDELLWVIYKNNIVIPKVRGVFRKELMGIEREFIGMKNVLAKFFTYFKYWEEGKDIDDELLRSWKLLKKTRLRNEIAGMLELWEIINKKTKDNMFFLLEDNISVMDTIKEELEKLIEDRIVEVVRYNLNKGNQHKAIQIFNKLNITHPNFMNNREKLKNKVKLALKKTISK